MTETLYNVIQLMGIEFIDLIAFASVIVAVTTWTCRRQIEDMRSESTSNVLGKTFARVVIWADAMALLTWTFFVSAVANNEKINMNAAWSTADQWLSTLALLSVVAALYWLFGEILNSKAWQRHLSDKADAAYMSHFD